MACFCAAGRLAVIRQQVVHSTLIGDADVSEQTSSREGRMNAHKNARLMSDGRAVLMRRVLEYGQAPKAGVAVFGVCPEIVAKWVARFCTEGIVGLWDRSSRPHKLRHLTLEYAICWIEALRRQRWTGQRVATELGISPSTEGLPQFLSAPISTSAISEPDPTHRKPTERPNDSYKPPSGNGPMQPPIRSPRNGTTSFQLGFIATIGIGLTVVSKSRHPLADWAWTGTTYRTSTARIYG